MAANGGPGTAGQPQPDPIRGGDLAAVGAVAPAAVKQKEENNQKPVALLFLYSVIPLCAFQ